MKALKWIIGIVIVIILVWIGVSSSQKGDESSETEPVRIGFVGPLSGDVANFGENARAAVQIAVEEVNASGGINGRDLEVIYEDGACSGTDAVNAVNKLVNVDNVSVVLGGTCSPETLAMAPILESAGVVGLSYCSTAPKITDAGDYIFRDVPSDLFQANFAADYLYNELGKRKAAIVYVQNDWGLGIQEAFTEAFEELGGEILLAEAHSSDSKDLRSQLTKVANSDADVLYFPAFPDSSIAGVRQTREVGVDVTLFGADAWDDPKMWEEIGAAGEGAFFVAGKTNSTDEFKAKMAEKLGSDEIIYCSNYAYDGLKLLAQVMNDVGTDSEAIKNALYEVRYEGEVSQPVIEFDQNGDPKTAVYTLKRVENGVPVVVE